MGGYTESLSEGFDDPDADGVRTNGKEIAIALEGGRYFIADPKQSQFFVGYALQIQGENGLRISWEGNTADRLFTWEEIQKMTEDGGYSYIGYGHVKNDTRVFFARPWITNTGKNPDTRLFVYSNVGEKEILKRYNAVVQSGTLQAHLFDLLNHPDTVKVDIVRVRDGDNSTQETGYGLKDPSIHLQARNPGISREQTSFVSQMKNILRSLREMGYEEILAEPSDPRRARIYMAAGLHPVPGHDNLLQGSIEEILNRKATGA